MNDIDLIEVVERVLARRGDLQSEIDRMNAEIAKIDLELDGARAVLGIPEMPRAPEVQQQPDLRGKTRQQVLDALAEQEPQTVAMLTARIKKSTVSLTCATMTLDRLIVCRQIQTNPPKRGGGARWYARSEAAFDGFTPEQSDADGPSDDAG